MAREGLLNQKVFYFFQAHVFDFGRTGLITFQSQIAGLYLLTGTHEHATLDRVVQFPHISRPWMLQHALHGGGLESGYRLAIALGVDFEEVAGQERDIFAPLTQWR